MDIALICHKGPDIEAAWQRMRQSFDTDDRLKTTAIRSVARILELKRTYLERRRAST